MVRPNFAFAEPQVERLRELSQVTDIPSSEHVRRAVDEYLDRVWSKYEKEILLRRKLFRQHQQQMVDYEKDEVETITHDELLAKLKEQGVHVGS